MSKHVEIVKTPEVLGGKPRVEGTRIGVRMIGDMVCRGDWTVEEITSDEHRDEGAAYADRLEAAGVDVEHIHYENQIHAFLSLYEHIDEGRAAIADAAARLEDGLS